MTAEETAAPGSSSSVGAAAASAAAAPASMAAAAAEPEEEECAVCLADFEQGDLLRQMRCGHRFHCACIDEWLIGKGRAHAATSGAQAHVPACPLCKAPALTEDEWAASGRALVERRRSPP